MTRRGVADSTYRAVGYLDKVIDDGRQFYEFRYLEAAIQDAQFLSIVGFGSVHRQYRSSRLFPSFADRVMSAKRPDRPVYLAGLDLESDADAWEILAASGGHREGDPIELISLPTWDSETHETTAHFLAHGVRHRDATASAYISTLASGAQLMLEREPGNETNPKAVRITGAGMHLGYVPDPLLDHVHSVMRYGAWELTVVRANPPETHPHLRLLLSLTGRCEQFVFDKSEWLPVA
ncbi:HIRAN domain-containing protein [Rhodococcoides fascians]|uniref:HIRAN domain-containing protein n=1 Tax=Rhodococcoides fascians TaxID=1828 RepID=UPI0034D65F27